jgi:Phosphotransferase system, galactitol-specific IIC component
MEAVLNYILGLGAAIFLPVIMIILGLCMGMKPKKAIIAGITLGIAFTGMNVVLGFMFDAISPAAKALVERTGLELTAIDVGWSPIAAIAWAWPYALLLFPIQIAINLIMLALKWTNCLNVDLWNVWGKIFVAAMVTSLTGSLAFGLIAAGIQIVFELINADLIQKQLYNICKIPGVTCTHPMMLQAPFLALINRMVDFVPGINKINMDAKDLKNKLGIFGENSVMGFIVGGLIAGMGGYDFKGIVVTAMQVATAMVLFPMVAKLFMQALAPIADATSTFMKSKFKGRDFYVGLDWPFLAGQSEIWVTAIILVPFELILAIVMSQLGMNNVIPLASIINVVVAVPALVVARGNLIRMIIISLIATPMYLAVATSFAPMLTKMAADTGTLQVAAGQYITWIQLEAPEFRWALAHAFNGEVAGVAVLAAFFVGFVWYFKHMTAINRSFDEKK